MNELQQLKKALWFHRFTALDEYVAATHTVVNSLSKSRKGAWYERVLAVSASVGSVGALFIPRGGIEAIPVRCGFHKVDFGYTLSSFMVELLQGIEPTWGVTVGAVGRGEGKIKIQGWEGAGVLLIEHDNTVSEHPHYRPRIYASDTGDIQKLLSESLWGRPDNKHGFKILVEDKGNFYGGPSFSMVPLPYPGDYVGDDLPDKALRNLQREIGDKGRVLLLVGPTGAGKTVFAQKVVQGWPGNGHRILKITGETLTRLGPNEIRLLSQYLNPTVLLLDDIPLGADNGEKYLDLFDSLRGNTQLVIATHMNENVKQLTSGKPGSLYWPGMRPGRVDEIMVIAPPNAVKREVILRFYLGGSPIPGDLFPLVLKASEGFTGAFLKELAQRLQNRGWDTWKDHILSLKCQAPAGMFGAGASTQPKRKQKIPEISQDAGKPDVIMV